MKLIKHLIFVLALLAVLPARGATNVVTSVADDSSVGSLRTLIASAVSGDTIIFTNTLSGATITLASTLTINTNLTIDASSLSGGIQISGNGSIQIFNVTSSNTVVLNSLTITKGNSGNGSGIYNGGTLTVNECTLSGNGNGGSVGGGIYNGGTLTVNQCTLTGNSAFQGGGICNGGTLTVNQCTLTENSAGGGGGIYNLGTLFLLNSIVAANSANQVGDIYNFGNITFEKSNIVQALDNYTGSTSTGPAPINVPPLLNALANYGGPTQTMLPLPGSPAIAAGSVVGNTFATDQRGYPRVLNGLIDIGAVELELQSSPIVILNSDSGSGSLRYAIEYATNGSVITFATNLSGATIVLASTLTINTNLVIDASALPSGIQINGNGSVQVFNVASSNTAVLNSLTITNGKSVNGGGIYNAGALTVNECTLAGNVAHYGSGGGIYNTGTLTVNQCTLSGNSWVRNPAGGGGGSGGGVYNTGTLMVNQCTLSENTGDCIHNSGSGILTLFNSIVAGNNGGQGADIFNTSSSFTFSGSNIVQSLRNTGTIIGSASITNAPLLATLGNYGGTTETMPLLPSSPAIDAGSDAAINIFATDQRGFPRLSGLHVDIGAVELQVIIASNPSVLTGMTRSGNGPFGFNFTNLTGASFTVFASTNLALPFNTWFNLGQALESPGGSGQFQFTDPQATNNVKRFYRVRSP